MQTIVDVDRDVAEKAFAECGTDIDLLDEFVTLMHNGVALVSGRAIHRDVNLLGLLLMARAVNSLWRAREDAVHGYPIQSLTQIRAALENWGTLEYCESNPQFMELWLRGVDGVTDGTPRVPTFSDIWKSMDAQLGEKAAKAYGELSLFAHPRDGGMRWVYRAEGETTSFHMGGHFDRDDVNFCLYYATTVAQLFLRNVGGIQKRMLGAVDGSWVADGNDVTRRGEEFLTRVNHYVASIVNSTTTLSSTDP